MTARIETRGNRLVVTGRFDLSDLRRFLAALYQVTVKLGYQDVVLDLSSCVAGATSAFAAVCSQVVATRQKGVDFTVVLPQEVRLANFLRSTNVAHLLAPDTHRESAYRGYTNMPLVQFQDTTGQSQVVTKFIDALLSSIPELERGDFAAIEWALNEITDNVLIHANSATGGIVQLSSFKQRRQVQFAVVDSGQGIPSTLRQGHPELTDDAKALERAIREGVTRDPKVGQGNGLFGTFEIARASGGFMHIHSGYARLSYEKQQLRYTREEVPFRGTLVVACMDCSNPKVLAEALRFDRKPYSPLDYIQTHYEEAGGGDSVLHLANEVASFGSRVAGEPVRTKIANLIRMSPGRRLVIDLSGVAIVSSSFADEVFGKLFSALGPLRFGQALELRGVSQTVQALIDKAILQRVSSQK